jgi:alpha-tubulin suppressor-like RCC1 family protein
MYDIIDILSLNYFLCQMNSFTTIPFVDLLSFLSSYPIPTNNYVYTNKSQVYETALQIIRSEEVKNNHVITAPISVIDWIRADNKLSTGINVNRFTTSSILSSSDDLLLELADILMLNQYDKERIIRFLGYLNLLDNDISIFDTLPSKILFAILRNLDCDELLLTCLISSKFNKLSQKDKFTQILRNKLRKRTGLKLNRYDRKELVLINKTKKRPNISTVNDHCFYVKDRNIYAFGKGINNIFDTDIPILISNSNNIKQISASGHHTLVLTKEGQVYSVGNNESGQLGLGHCNYIDKFTLISGLKNIVQISAGDNHSLLLTQNGEIYSCGSNFGGQLGLGDSKNQTKPTLVPNINNIIQISAGGYYSLLLNKNGEVYSFGNDWFGKLGLGNCRSRSRTVPTLIPTEYFNNSPIVQISAGRYHSLALSIEGDIYSFGYGSDGRLGLGDNNDRNRPTLIPAYYFNNVPVSHVSAGLHYSLIVTEKGQLYSFGNMFHQYVGIEENYIGNVPTLINGLENFIDVPTGGSSYLMVNKYGEINYLSKSNKSEEIRHAPLLLDKIL